MRKKSDIFTEKEAIFAEETPSRINGMNANQQYEARVGFTVWHSPPLSGGL